MVLLLAVLVPTAACGDYTAAPEPNPLPPASDHTHRESDDWIKPGANVILKGGIAEAEDGRSFRIVNADTFTWTLLDDIWLGVRWNYKDTTPQGTVSGGNQYAYLRCPAPRTIPPGKDTEVQIDTCRATTVEPGPDALVISYRFVAKEGAREANMEPGFRLVRRQE